MLQNLLVVIGQVVTLFLLMGVGFLLGRKQRFTGEGLSQMTYLLLYVVAGCIVIDALQVERDPALLLDLAVGTAAVAGIYLLNALLVLPLFRREEADTRDTLRFGVVYGNTGFMGLPLILGILGPRAMLFAVVSFVVFTLFSWMHGVFIMGGRSAVSVKKVLLNPGTISVAIGLPLFLLDVRLPDMLGSAVGYLADLNTPLAMVVIGAQMSRTDLAAAFRQRRLYAASLLKLVVFPLITALILLPLHLNPMLYSATVILAAAPTAGLTSMFAQQFNRDTASAAQLVTISTVLSVVTLPCFAVLAQNLAG